MEQVRVKPIIMPAIIAAVFLLFDNLISIFYSVQMMISNIDYFDFIPYYGVFNGLHMILNVLIVILLIVGLILILAKPTAGLGILIAPVVLSVINAFINGVMFIGFGSFNLVTVIVGILISGCLLIAVIGGLATQQKAVGAERKILNVKFTVMSVNMIFIGLMVSRVSNALEMIFSEYSVDGGTNYSVILAIGLLGLVVSIGVLVLAFVFNQKTKIVAAVFMIVFGVVALLVGFMLIAVTAMDFEYLLENPLALTVYAELLFSPIMIIIMGIYGTTIKSEAVPYQVNY
ncbi:hypothetical protein [Culicoidibacter larvae]|uniref:Uncharacterized protein n=1 Tax=Culicoidibacter larvae TaxID=2579976 RepID=A0A5R8QB52_9FIRM|nr:hypothetical protein [Culicoidibacter larvae]TLG73778.1 hypothetical protein FEZ08_06500 [Culicoidibacter larvae]